MAKKMRKRAISFVLAVAMVCTGVVAPGNADTLKAAKKASLKTKSLTVTVGKKKTITVKNKVKKAKYTFKSSKKKIATVSTKGVVKGVKKGKAIITVTETKKGKKKGKVIGKVKVTVKAKKSSTTNTTPNTPVNPTNPPAGPTTPPASATDTPSKPTNTPARPTSNPVPTIDPDDDTFEAEWEKFPIVENFDDESKIIVKNSDTSGAKTTYVEEGGIDNSGYVVIAKDQYNGPTIFFDNRLGTESKSFLCSAYIKAADEDGLYNTVDMWVGNKYQNSAYVCELYSVPASRRLSDKWEQIIGVITVPAGKFKEIRIKSDNADYCIDNLVAKELEAGDNTEMEPNPEKPAPENAITEEFTMNADSITVDSSSWGGKKNEDGSYSIPNSWRNIIIPLPNYVDLSKFTGITINGSASTNYRISFFDEFKNNLMGNNAFVYPGAGFDDKATIPISISGYAKYMFIGSCDSGEDLELTIESITFKGPVNTDGITEADKAVGNNNPIATQRFMADPYAIEYNGTVYVYGTNDTQQLVPNDEGKYEENNYSRIKTLNCYSSKDMVNWTDEGIIKVGGKDGAATWANNSWAPAVTYKNINGKDKFFIYFANSANNIGVLEGDSPTGPWRDPIGKPLIDRNTPTCSTSEIEWLFDPAVLVDDDGQGYLYFGGIGNAKDREHPKCSRVVKLGDDMVSLKGDPVVIDAPAMFEDSGINKIGDKYYYSYCTNFSSGTTTGTYGTGTIVYMVSDDPMTGWEMGGAVLDNPGKFFPGASGNNHHCMLERNGELYMFYHTMKMGIEMGYPSGYRTTSIDKITKTGDALTASMTMAGVEADATFNPFTTVEAETFAWSVGTSTLAGPTQEGRNNRVLSSITAGDYVGLDNVDFGTDGAKSLTMNIASEGETGKVKVYLDSMEDANLVGELDVTATGSAETYKDMSVNLTKTVTGTHKLFFVFDVKDILVDTWAFSKDEVTAGTPEVVEPLVINIGKAFNITEEAGLYNNQINVDLTKLLPADFDISNYVLCNVDATFYADTEGREVVAPAALKTLKGTDGGKTINRVGKIALDDGTHKPWDNGIVANNTFGRVQGLNSIPVENWRSDNQPKSLTGLMFNRTDIQSVKINSLTFVPKSSEASEYKVELNDLWDLTAGENNKVRELSIADKLTSGFDVAGYDYCTIDAEFYSDTAGNEVIEESVLNALPYGEWNTTGRLGLGVAAASIWSSFPESTLTYNFGRTQKSYDISLSPWCESGQPGKILYEIYPDRLDTIKSIKIKSITFKKN